MTLACLPDSGVNQGDTGTPVMIVMDFLASSEELRWS